MASSINASTSGAGGVITTADASGNLNIQSGGSTVLALTSSGVAITGTLTASGTSFGNSTLKIVTDSTDIALTADPTSTYYNFGSTFSVNIPTSGLIRIVSFVGRVQNSTNSQGGGPTFGIRIGSTNYWLCKGVIQNPSTTTRYGAFLIESYAVSNTYIETYGTNATHTSGAEYGSPHIIDIAYNSIPTGTQTIQLICAKKSYSHTDSVTLKGTVITTKVGIEFVSAS